MDGLVGQFVIRAEVGLGFIYSEGRLKGRNLSQIESEFQWKLKNRRNIV